MWDIVKCLNFKLALCWIVTLLITCVPSPLFAAFFTGSLSVSVSKKQINVSDTLTLTIVFKGSGVERISLPQPFPNNFTVINKADRPSLSQDISGRPVTIRVIEYTLQATTGGRFRLGNLSISHNGETYQSNGQEVEIKGASLPPVKEKPIELPPNPQPRELTPVNIPVDVRLSAELSQKQAYVGEVVTLSIRVTSTTAIDQIKPVDIPAFVNFWNNELVLNKQSTEYREVTIKGLPYATQVIHRFTLSPTTSGKLSIPELTYSMVAGNDPSKSKALTLKTTPLTLEAIPLPEKGRPTEFSGAVGKSKLKVTLKDQTTSVGVPTKLIIEVETAANPETIAPPTNPETGANLKLYAPKPVKIDPEKPPTTSAIWEAEVIACEPGKLTIPAFTFAYFDPQSAKYKILQSEPLSLEVNPVANVVLSPSKTTVPATGFSLPSVITYLGMLLLLAVGIGIGFKLKQLRPLGAVNVTTNSELTIEPVEPESIVPVILSPSAPSSFAPPGFVEPVTPTSPVIPVTAVTITPIIPASIPSFAPPTPLTIPDPPIAPITATPIFNFTPHDPPPVPDTPIIPAVVIPVPIVPISTPDPVELPVLEIPEIVVPAPPITLATNIVPSKPAKVSKPSKPSKPDKPSKPSKHSKPDKSTDKVTKPIVTPVPIMTIAPTLEPIISISKPVTPATPSPSIKTTEPISIPITEAKETKTEKPLPTPIVAPVPIPQRELVKLITTIKPASTVTVPSKTFKADTSRLVNAAYGKLHRGDEKAYCKELLKALILIFENGFRTPASELSTEKMLELLNSRATDSNLRDSIIKLYQECEEISLSSTQTDHVPNSEKDYVRFVKAKALMERFLTIAS